MCSFFYSNSALKSPFISISPIQSDSQTPLKYAEDDRTAMTRKRLMAETYSLAYPFRCLIRSDSCIRMALSPSAFGK